MNHALTRFPAPPRITLAALAPCLSHTMSPTRITGLEIVRTKGIFVGGLA